MGRASIASLGRLFGDRTRLFFGALACILALGAWLRIAGSSGALWFDEIWSLQNLEGLSGPGGIIWGISQDNNHFLNSLWLWLVGPGASPLRMRAMAIAFGCGSIVMASRIVHREAGRTGALTAALLFAASPILVQYGSEARGYSGMVFGLLWAVDALSRFLDQPRANRPRLEFGLAIAIGALSHIEMLPAAAVLAGAVVVCIAWRTHEVAEVARAARDLASAYTLGAAPVGLAIAAGILNTHVIRFGDQTPFTVEKWLEGLGAMERTTLALPQSFGDAAPLAATLGLIAVAALAIRRDFVLLTGALVVVFPLAEAAVRMPNVHIARFHLACAIGLLLLLASVLARLWERAGHMRVVAGALLAAGALGATVSLAAFLQAGRGDYVGAIRTMGTGTYTSNDEAIAKRTVRFYAPRVGAQLEWTSADRCGHLPDWFVHVDDNRNTNPPASTEMLGPASCQVAYNLRSVHPYAGLSGVRWSIYRRADSSESNAAGHGSTQ